MNPNPQLERDLPLILAELGAGVKPDYADDILARTRDVRQRPAWMFPAGWNADDTGRFARPSLALPWRMIALVVLLILAAVAAITYAGSRPRVPSPFGPARNGLIVYGSGGDIYAGDPVTGTSTTISGRPEYESGPFVAPDGTHVAFMRQADQTLNSAVDIVVARIDGSAARVITQTPLAEIPRAASWTPDGSSIAIVTSARADGALEFLDATEGQPPRMVLPAPDMRIDGVAFQPPDGRRLLFRGQIAYTIGLFTMKADGSDLRTLVEPYLSIVPQDSNFGIAGQTALADLRDPAWSPDGSQVVFRQLRHVDGVDAMRLFIVNADGTGLRQVGFTSGDTVDAYPAWSPDGSRLAFLRFRDGDWTCVVVRLDDGRVIPTGPVIPGGLAALDWSPDGRRLLLVLHDADQTAILLDPDGGPAETVPWQVESPGWWVDRAIPNAAAAGAWQRLATP
jgi:hypothetical protein